MALLALCPKCSAAVLGVTLSEIPVYADGDTTKGGTHWGVSHWAGVVYSCRSCGCVLSVGIDPVSLKNDLRDELLVALRKDHLLSSLP